MLRNVCVIKPNTIVDTIAIDHNSSPPSQSSLRKLEGKNSWTLCHSICSWVAWVAQINFKSYWKYEHFRTDQRIDTNFPNVFLWRQIHRLLQIILWPHTGLYETTLFPVHMVLRLIRWWEAGCKTIIYFWYNLIKDKGLCAVSANLAVNS